MSDSSISLQYSEGKVTFECLKNSTKNKDMLAILNRTEVLSRHKSDKPLLLLGDTGVGKNNIAQAIHNEKGRKKFYEIPIVGIPENLIETELFGYVKGAFTGADKDKMGLVEAAEGGTLFIDEIGEIPTTIQVKLLRLMEQKKFRKVGGTDDQKCDVYIVCATNKSWQELQEHKLFRQDLLYRMLDTIIIPPLRDRKEDLEELIEQFTNQFSAEIGCEFVLDDVCYEKLLKYNWPGNIRELKHVIQKTLIWAASTGSMNKKKIMLNHLPEEIVNHEEKNASEGIDLKNLQDHIIQNVYKYYGEDVKKTAKIFGVGKDTVYRALDRLKKE